MTHRKTFFLIDGDGYIHRAYHALPPLTNSKGEPAGALFGFAKMLQKVLKDQKPDRVAVCFDTAAPTFRHKAYKEYKAQRKELEDGLKFQLPLAKAMAADWGLPVARLEGWEADDLIATLAAKAVKEGMNVVVVSADKDLLQLVDDHVKVLNDSKGILFDAGEVEKKYGLKPGQLVDYFALVGDSSDNVPGVEGVGDKTAVALLQEYGSLDHLYKSLEKLKPVMKDRLASQKEVAYLSRDLVTLDAKAPVDLDPDSCVPGEPTAALAALFQRFEFHRLLAELPVSVPSAPSPTSGWERVGVRGEAGSFRSKTLMPPSSAPLGHLLPPEVGEGKVGREATPARRVHTVLTVDDLKELVGALKAAGDLSVDVETNGVNPLACSLVGISLSVKAGEAWYVPVGHRGLGEPDQLPLAALRDALGPIFSDDKLRKRGQNLKFDLLVLERHGLPLQGIAFDTMVAAYCLNSSRPLGLKALAQEILGETMTPIDALIGTGKKQITMDQVPVKAAAEYAGADAEVTFRLADRFGPDLKDKGMDGLFHEVEMPLVLLLAGMERAGIAVDRPYLEELRGRFRKDISALEKELYALAGTEVNLNSPKQLGFLLFEKLKLPVIKKTKTGYSTDEDVLQKLSPRHPFPAKLLEYRELAKLSSTYVDGILASVDPATGRVHSRFNQTVAATGRLSSSDPNLQNIPIRTEHGRRIRRAFVPGKGNVFLSIDYSQIDLRVLAHMSGDPALCDAFRHGKDVHAATARDLFGLKPEDAVDDEQRRIAKTVNFGIVYGQTPYGLAGQLGIPQAQAKEFIERYMARYAGVTRWIDETIARARKEGFVTTLLHRRRYLPEINAANPSLRGFSERMAMNTPIQGTSADIIKVAMGGVARLIEKKKWKTRMLLQVHDDLLFEVPEGEFDEVAPAVKSAMESAVALHVPVVADLKKGVNWAEMEKVNAQRVGK